MTYPNENTNTNNIRSDPAVNRDSRSSMPWILGAIALFLVGAFLLWGMSDNTNVATNTNTSGAATSDRLPQTPTGSVTPGPATNSNTTGSAISPAPNAPAPAK